jgi:hypothetical protein
MAKKIKKSIPWITMAFLFAMVFFAGFIVLKEALADTTYILPEVTVLNVAPSLGSITFNLGPSGANPIAITENSLVAIMATTVITDTNGYNDIKYATASLYHSATTCGANNFDNSNWCYYNASNSSECFTSSCSGSSCDLSCRFGVWFTAIPTDASSSPYAANFWRVDIKVMDGSNASGTGYATNELSVAAYAAFTSSWSYLCNGGICNRDQTSSQATTTATNTGNYQINLELSGTIMEAAGGLTMDSRQQKYATETNMGDWATGTQLRQTPTRFQMYIEKPTATTSNSQGNVYWQIKIPSGQDSGSYSGTNTISAVWTN